MIVHIVSCNLRNANAVLVSSNEFDVYTILVNNSLSEARQKKEVLHELRHIIQGDLFSHINVQDIEIINHNSTSSFEDYQDINFYWHVVDC